MYPPICRHLLTQKHRQHDDTKQRHSIVNRPIRARLPRHKALPRPLIRNHRPLIPRFHAPL